jgi:protein-disulfide isomerase
VIRPLARCVVAWAALSSAAAGQTPVAATEAAIPAAVVGDRILTLADVDRAWQQAEPAEYAEAMQRTYDARRKFSDLLIAEEVLAREARARGLTTEQLLAEELPRHTLKTAETDVEAMYRLLGDGAKAATLEQMRPALRAYLERRGPEAAKGRLVAELLATSIRARVLLEPPRMMFESTEQDAVRGPSTALVEIVAFGDFQNPAYVEGAQSLAALRDTFGDKIRIVFKSLPAANQPIPIGAAVAAQCAKEQDQFWPYHDALLRHPMRLDADILKREATTLGLNRRIFDACFEGDHARAVVNRAIDEAGRYGLHAAPRYFVNGRPVTAPAPFTVLKPLVEEELLLKSRSPSPSAR